MINLAFLPQSWILSALLVMIPSIALCTGILWFVRKMVSSKALQKNHDVAGFTFSIIGVLYSVLLGFTVINVEERYVKAEENIEKEAMILADLYRSAAYFDDLDREEIRSVLREYVKYIAKEEWEDINQENIHIKAQKVLEQIWNRYDAVVPQNQKMWMWYEKSVEKLDSLMNARLLRQFNAWQHLSPMMWTLLIAGAVITICFMFFFGLENLRTQMLMTALLAGYLAFMLYLVFCLDHVFKGPEAIHPSAFQEVLILFDRWDPASS
jgi:hypothetical protein